MANTQFEAYRRQYTDTLTHLFDQDRKFLQDAVTVDTDITGATKIFPFVGNVTSQRKTGRNEITIHTEPDFSARHMRIVTDYCAVPLDMDDVIRMVSNPMSDIYWEVKNALHEARTKVIMEGFFADVTTGEGGGSTVVFPAANKVAVNYSGGPFAQNAGAADVGLNLDKLLRVRSLLSAKKVRANMSPSTQLHIAVSEDDVQAMMANKIGSDQYPLIDKLNSLQASFEKATENINDAMFSWYGFQFHVIPKDFFALDASGDRLLPVWVKDGMVLGIKNDVDSEIHKRPDMVDTTEVKVLTRHGAMRKMEAKVYQIAVNA